MTIVMLYKLKLMAIIFLVWLVLQPLMVNYSRQFRVKGDELNANLVYSTDFENITKTGSNILNMSILIDFNLGSGNASIWMEGVDRTDGPTPHSGSRCVGMEVTSRASDQRNEFNILGLNNLVGSKLFVSVWLYLPSNWVLNDTVGNWYEIANPQFEYNPPAYIPYWTIWIDSPTSYRLSIGMRDLNHQLVTMAQTPLGSVVQDPQNLYPLPRGRWFNLQYYVLRSSASGVADGAIKVWIDGKVVCDLSNVVTSGGVDWFTTPAKIYGSLVQSAMPYKIWVDDLEIWDDYWKTTNLNDFSLLKLWVIGVMLVPFLAIAIVVYLIIRSIKLSKQEYVEKEIMKFIEQFPNVNQLNPGYYKRKVAKIKQEAEKQFDELIKTEHIVVIRTPIRKHIIKALKKKLKKPS